MEEKGMKKHLKAWIDENEKNPFVVDIDLQHTIEMYSDNSLLHRELTEFGERVIKEAEPLVQENHLPQNLPRIVRYNGIGELCEKVVHHPSYDAIGDIIYSSRIMERMAKPGGLLEALCFMFLSSVLGEAGHNCPIACSAGLLRVLNKVDNIKQKEMYIQKLLAPSFRENFTAAQFVTEVQGGSDVGANLVIARKENDQWTIHGEKWFCSNANAELILLTARFDPTLSGTKGLGLFLVPARLETGEQNRYSMRRLKTKMGTKTLATAEIDFQGAIAIAVGNLDEGFKLLMENVLHISRIFNAFCVVGMARRAYHIAHSYAKHRYAFSHPILSFPLVQETLAIIKAENAALLSSIFSVAHLQDQFDQGRIKGDENKLLLRLLVNLNKYLTALWSVKHIHHSLDILAGNGTIETFSSLPRLFGDSIICENWEGTHNVLRMQILRDIHRYEIDQLFVKHIESLEIDDSASEYLKWLKEDLEYFRSNDSDLQALQIKHIVHAMALLYSCCQLKKEADDQSKKKGSESKKQSYKLFVEYHMKNRLQLPNESYLKNLVGEIRSQSGFGN